MKQVEIEISAQITFNQTLVLSDEDAAYLKEHEGYSATPWGTHGKELYKFLEPKLDFDCISEIKDLDVDIVDILEEEKENDSN